MFIPLNKRCKNNCFYTLVRLYAECALQNKEIWMKEKELYTKLKEAYLDENLNRITGKLIELYKSKKFGQILTLANKIFRYELIDEKKDAKCFYKLIMLYHPDKGEYYRKTIGGIIFGK